MALTQIDYVDVFYGSAMRRVSLNTGDLSDLEVSDGVNYLAVSALPNTYTGDGWLLDDLAANGISVQSLAANKLADYRPAIPCWVSQVVPNANFQNIVVFEPTVSSVTSYDFTKYIFSAIRTVKGSPFTPTVVALPLVSTIVGGADESRMLQYLFYSAANSCGRVEEFSEIKIVLYKTQTSVNTLAQVFASLKNAYDDILVNNYFSDYNTYSKQVQQQLSTVTLPPYLTYRQAFGICMYTSNFYTTINAVLRADNETTQDFVNLQALLEAIDTGLQNIPQTEKVGYRGESYVSESRLMANEPTGEPVNIAYTSSAYTPGTWYTTSPFQFQITSLKGVVVEQYSMYPSEQELLFIRLMKYLVNSIAVANTYFFDCSEMPQPYR
ncbi:MAG: hypothetical protein LBQ22_00035 [Bacteroidales bacterium]|jgi:hypothetical protein|nr:hypothetical protein [Bacteroidales bacterium]